MLVVIKLILIIGFCSKFPTVSSQVTYVIGIQSQFLAGASLSLNMSANIIVQYVSVSIQDATTIQTLQTESQRLFGLRLDYLIYIYNLTASLALNNIFHTNSKVIPYLVLPELVDNPIMNPNMFYIEYQEKMASDATRALLTYLNAVNIVYIDYTLASTSKNLVAFNSFGQTLILLSNSSQWPDALQYVFHNNTQRFYVCSIPFTESTLITNLLTEAMYKGQLNPGKVWIFNHVTSNVSNFNTFQQFSGVGADIYSFSVTFSSTVEVANLASLQQFVARDYVRIIAQSINNTVVKPANLSQQLLQTVLPIGELVTNAGLNASNNQFNGTIINVLRVNTSPAPLPKFTYTSTLNEVNASAIIRPLNHSLITVRIGVVFMKGYFMQNSQGVYYGYSVALLKELLKLSNFKYTFVFPNDNQTGEVLTKNGTGVAYTGIVSLITQNLVDMSIIPMVPTNIRNVIFASDSILTFKMNMISRTVDQSLYFTLILVPFTYNVWLGILLILLIMTMAFWTINRISPNHSKKCKKPGNVKAQSYSFPYSLLVIYSSFVTAKLKIKPKKASLHIFAFILWFSTLTFVITYASNMVPFMMVPNQAYPFKNVSSLLQNTTQTFQWGFVRNSMEQEIVKNDSVLSALYNIAVANWSTLALFDETNSETALNINKFILIQADNKNGYLYNRICTSTVFTGTTNQYAAVLALRPDWKQRPEMSSLITQIIASGALNGIDNRYFNLGPCAVSQYSVTPRPVTLNLLSTVGLFLLPLAGIVFGLLVTICQVFKNKVTRCVQNTKMNKFIYGEVYDAKIHSIDNDGVWAIINERIRPYFVTSTSLHPDLRKKHTIKELNIHKDDVIRLKYFGKDPVNGYKRFCRDMEDM